ASGASTPAAQAEAAPAQPVATVEAEVTAAPSEQPRAEHADAEAAAQATTEATTEAHADTGASAQAAQAEVSQPKATAAAVEQAPVAAPASAPAAAAAQGSNERASNDPRRSDAVKHPSQLAPAQRPVRPEPVNEFLTITHVPAVAPQRASNDPRGQASNSPASATSAQTENA